MKVLIIEDEKPAAHKLLRLLREINPDIEVMDVLKSVEESINWFLHNPKPDLIFMDIQLEDGICFEIFGNKPIHTPIIFTTAYDEYTLRAFKVNSIDYLLKPIDSDELKNAIEKKEIRNDIDISIMSMNYISAIVGIAGHFLHSNSVSLAVSSMRGQLNELYKLMKIT